MIASRRSQSWTGRGKCHYRGMTAPLCQRQRRWWLRPWWWREISRVLTTQGARWSRVGLLVAVPLLGGRWSWWRCTQSPVRAPHRRLCNRSDRRRTQGPSRRARGSPRRRCSCRTGPPRSALRLGTPGPAYCRSVSNFLAEAAARRWKCVRSIGIRWQRTPCGTAVIPR